MEGGDPPDCNGGSDGPECDEGSDGPDCQHEDAAADARAPPPGDAFDLLADDRVRYALYLLRAFGGTTGLDELATGLAAREEGVEPGAVDDDARHRVETDLYHSEVPKLTDRGVVDFDADTAAVTLTDCGERLAPYLEFARERERADVDAFVEQCRRHRR